MSAPRVGKGAVFVAVWLALSATASCRREPTARGNEPGGVAAAAPIPDAERLEALRRAELARDAAAVTDEDLVAVSTARRRAAARTLAILGASERLGPALADSDAEVVTWAALGLGRTCRGRAAESVRRLAIRAASLLAGAEPLGGDANAQERALRSILRALGECGSEEAERTLVSLLGVPQATQPASFALGRIASARGRLEDASVVALLDAAQPERASRAPLHAVSRLPSLGAATRARLAEVAGAALDRPTPDRIFAVRALARADSVAAPKLATFVTRPEGVSDAERCDAVRSLGALGADGQAAVADSLPALAAPVADDAALATAAFAPVIAALDALSASERAEAVLKQLAARPIPDASFLKRRAVQLRCRAAALLAGRASASAALLACDPDPNGREGRLAVLRVLGRGELDGARGKRFQELARSNDRVVREAALELLPSHDEVPNAAALLAEALSASELGVAATAAKVIARFPARASVAREGGGTRAVDARVVTALTEALDRAERATASEPLAWLLDAASALELLGAKPAAERACASPNGALRQRAASALRRLGQEGAQCDAPLATSRVTPAPPPASVRLELETEAGPLWLELSGEAAPRAVAHLRELARSSFYDGSSVQRVVPGYVVQFGDPGEDGFGGSPLGPLPSEPGLSSFEEYAVGLAAAGPDTGDSQLFVTLSRAPELDGDYTWLGRASPDFAKLTTGDRIHRVRALP